MRVLYVQYTNPGAYPPLVRGAQLLAERGAEVLMLGVEIRGLEALSAEPVAGLSVRLMPSATEGWRLKADYARYAAWVVREASAWRPDWVYASDLLSAPVALALSRVTGARVVYHEHDAPSRAHQSWTIRRCLAARARLARDADVLVVPNAERARRFSREVAGGRPVVTVWNCPRRPSTSSAPPGRGVARAEQPLGVIFRGSINAERLPRAVIHALALAGVPTTLTIAGYETAGSRGYVAELLSLAERAGVDGQVRAVGTIPEAELAEMCVASDLGLALMPMDSDDENMRDMAGASNKVFEYLSYGVTPIVSDLLGWREAFVSPGYALACDPRDVASLVGTLRWAAEHRAEVRTMAEAGRRRLLDDWNYEAQFAPVLERMLAPGHEAQHERAPAVEAQCAS